VPQKDAIHRRLGRVTEPQILFPAVALLLLTVIWGTTLGVVKVRHADAEHAAAASSRELLDTYEAQVMRALGEIDQTLNLVRVWPDRQMSRHTLAELKAKGLLPPDLLFTVSIADRDGVVVHSRERTQNHRRSGHLPPATRKRRYLRRSNVAGTHRPREAAIQQTAD
jgi:hypothetical protein